MSLVSTSIANLVNGVSQQPNALRLSSQCELQENCNSSVVDGLCPRNGTKHSAKITDEPLTNAFTHLINRDRTERYRVIISDNSIMVYDLAGVRKTVTLEAGAAEYLMSAAPADDFVALTVADYTFILNKTVTVQQDNTDLVPAREPEALWWVKSAAQNATYTLTIDGHQGHVLTGSADPDGNPSPGSVATDYISSFMIGNGGGGVGSTFTSVQVAGADDTVYTYQRAGSSTVKITRVNGADFVAYCGDSFGDQASIIIKGSTQRFTDLPAIAVDGFKCEVQGEGGSFNQSYWVEYVAKTGAPFGGVWKETCKPNEVKSLLASTMPFVLVRNSDGTFTMKAADWASRTVGDVTKSNPMPSFVGRTLNDIFFHRNRLGLLSDENVIMSVAGDYFNFFKGSAIQVLDTDPIDIAVSTTKVAVLDHAVPFHETLMLFSEQTQFILGKTGDVLTVKTAAIDPTTDYENSKATKPITLGSFVYFTQNRNNFSLVREFGVDVYTQTKTAQDITAHVPKYIPGGVFKLTASDTESMLVALSHDAPSKLFIYQFYLSGDTKLQSAWHTWTFGPNDVILNADFIESDLHLLISRPDGVYMEVLTVTTSAVDGTRPFTLHMDRMVTEDTCFSVTYHDDIDQTSFELPYPVDLDEDYFLIAWDGNDKFKPGQQLKFSMTGSSVICLTKGRLTHFRWGRVMKSRYVFSQFEIREQTAGGGSTSIAEGRLNVRRMTLTHGKSGYFRVEVTPRSRDTYLNVMTGRQVGNGQSVLGDVSLIEGIFRVPIMARNIDVVIELTSDEPLPYSILSADWEGMFVARSRRM
jgi:hypothetical protein